VIAARRVEALERVAAELRTISPSSKVLAVKVDITSEEQVKNLFATVQKTFGRPADVLLNNAGYLKDDQLIGETAPSEWWTGIVSRYLNMYWELLTASKGDQPQRFIYHDALLHPISDQSQRADWNYHHGFFWACWFDWRWSIGIQYRENR
jgi:NAD(P)-dependent dehydrogenase (short-subunit alcohol dehydrogenase family)